MTAGNASQIRKRWRAAAANDDRQEVAEGDWIYPYWPASALPVLIWMALVIELRRCNKPAVAQACWLPAVGSVDLIGANGRRYCTRRFLIA